MGCYKYRGVDGAIKTLFNLKFGRPAFHFFTPLCFFKHATTLVHQNIELVEMIKTKSLFLLKRQDNKFKNDNIHK